MLDDDVTSSSASIRKTCANLEWIDFSTYTVLARLDDQLFEHGELTGWSKWTAYIKEILLYNVHRHNYTFPYAWPASSVKGDDVIAVDVHFHRRLET